MIKSCVNVQWFLWSKYSSHHKISGIICGVFKSLIVKLTLLEQERIPWIGPWSCPWSSSGTCLFNVSLASVAGFKFCEKVLANTVEVFLREVE
jgi:hypothetical protein